MLCPPPYREKENVGLQLWLSRVSITESPWDSGHNSLSPLYEELNTIACPEHTWQWKKGKGRSTWYQEGCVTMPALLRWLLLFFFFLEWRKGTVTLEKQVVLWRTKLTIWLKRCKHLRQASRGYLFSSTKSVYCRSALSSAAFLSVLIRSCLTSWNAKLIALKIEHCPRCIGWRLH